MTAAQRDVYFPGRWRDDALFAPDVKEAYVRLLGQSSIDALPHLHPDETIYTFWEYLQFAYERDAGLRIDHLLFNCWAADRLVEAQLDKRPRGWEKTSDYAPVWSELS